MKLKKKLAAALLPLFIFSGQPLQNNFKSNAQAHTQALTQTLEESKPIRIKKSYPVDLYNYNGRRVDQASIEVDVTDTLSGGNGKIILEVRTADWKDESKDKRLDRHQIFPTLTRLDISASKNVKILPSKQEAYLINYREGGKWNELTSPDTAEVQEAKKTLEEIVNKMFEIIIPDVEVRGVEIPVREKTQDLLQKFSKKYWKEYNKDKERILAELAKDYSVERIPNYTLLAKGAINEERLLKTLMKSFNHSTARRYEIPYVVKDDGQTTLEIYLEVGITSRDGEGARRDIYIPITRIKDFENLRKETAQLVESHEMRGSALAVILENEKNLEKIAKATTTQNPLPASTQTTQAASANIFPFQIGDKWFFDTYFTMPRATQFGISGTTTHDIDDDAVLQVTDKNVYSNVTHYFLKLYQGGQARYNFKLATTADDGGTLYFHESPDSNTYIKKITAADLEGLRPGYIFPVEYDLGGFKDKILGSLLKTKLRVRLEYDRNGFKYIEEILEGRGLLGIGSQRNTIKHYRTSFTQSGQRYKLKEDQDFLADILKTLRLAGTIKSLIDALKR